eukprot:scaffold6249_cov119-Skeletonema_dohrnii-CCMP3373.AAC.3
MKSLVLILVSYTTLLSIIHHTASSFSASSTTTTTITISPPSSADDYRQLTALLVSTFDAPQSCQEDDEVPLMERLQWDLFEKSLTEEFTYKRYVSLARKMRGKKYCLLVAKQIDEDSDDVSLSSLGSSNGVVGMVEMGMSLCPVDANNTSTTTDDDDMNNSSKEAMSPSPLIGVICVSPTHQKEGIGMKLLNKCEEVARDIWKEEFICVDVEPNNAPALSLFEMGGYMESFDGEGDALMRNTTILRRRRAEVKPHYLLRKRIRDDDDGCDPNDR